jgi:aspartate aminotransferase
MNPDFFSRSIADFVAPATVDVVRRARKLIADGQDMIILSIGQPDFATPDHVKEAAAAALRANDTGYTDMDGTAALKAAIAAKFRRENNLHYKSDQISIGAGASQVIFNALRATLNPGDEVIIAVPYWDIYSDMIKLAGGTPVYVVTKPEEGFKLQPQALEEAITKRTKWVILNSPNNPTGATFSLAELLAIAEVLERHPDVWIISDEVYEQHIYAYPHSISIAELSGGSLYPRTLTVNSFSKAYNMPGFRVGYAGGAAALIKHMLSVQSLVTMSPSSVSQAAAIAALQGDKGFLAANRAAFAERMKMAVSILNAVPGFSCAMPEGAFYLYVNCDGFIKASKAGRFRGDADVTTYLLNEAKVAVAPGESFGLSPYFRLSCTSPRLEEACQRIRKICEAAVV